jgi:hypothetical protein
MGKTMLPNTSYFVLIFKPNKKIRRKNKGSIKKKKQEMNMGA